jgi:hypothetical protein
MLDLDAAYGPATVRRFYDDDGVATREGSPPESEAREHQRLGAELREEGRPRSECMNIDQQHGWDEADDARRGGEAPNA